MIHDASHELLRVGGLFYCGVEGFAVEPDDGIAEAHVIDGLGGKQETGPDTVVDVAPAEPNPVAFPATLRQRMVAVPLAGEKQEQVAFVECGLFDGVAVEHPLALGDVEQLVFVAELAAFVYFKVVAVGMTAGGVGVAGADFFVADGGYGESP